MINRSGIEVAMHAEAELPVVLVVQTDRTNGPTPERSRCSRKEPGRAGRGLHLLIQHVETHVEVLGDVPLGTRADPPGVPVIVATGGGQGRSARARAGTDAENASRAQLRIGVVVIADLSVAAVERGPPTRAPEVLVSRIDVPSSGQLNVAPVQAGKCAAIDTVGDQADRSAVAFTKGPAALRCLHHVLDSALGVVDLGLEEVALADRKAKLVVGVAGVLKRAVVQRLDLVPGSHDLGRTPGLVDAQVGDDVGGVKASDHAGTKVCVDYSCRRYAAHFG